MAKDILRCSEHEPISMICLPDSKYFAEKIKSIGQVFRKNFQIFETKIR